MIKFHHLRNLCAIALATASLIGCGDREEPPPPANYANLGAFDTVAVQIVSDADTLQVQAELAATEDQRQLGLMEREQLGPNQGMLFVYDSMQAASGSFWMFRTRIPLDIAFIDSAGRIVAINQMEPCTSPYAQSCPTYPAGAPFQAALEVNQGFFAEHGIELGDVITIQER